MTMPADCASPPGLAAADAEPGAPKSARAMPRWRCDFGLALALWWRDMLRLRKEPSRWLGVVLQPLLFWFVLGSGMHDVFRVDAGFDYLRYFFPGIIAMVVLFTAVFATMSVIEDRQHGFLQQVLVVPGGRLAMVLGKTAGVTTVAVLQALLCLAAAPLAGCDIAAFEWGLLALVLLLTCVGLTAVNFALAWVIDSTAGYHAVLSVILLPLWMLSGAMYPPGEGWTLQVMAFNPMTYVVDGLRHAIDPSAASLAFASVPRALWILAAMALVGPYLAVRCVTRKIAQGRV